MFKNISNECSLGEHIRDFFLKHKKSVQFPKKEIGSSYNGILLIISIYYIQTVQQSFAMFPICVVTDRDVKNYMA